MDKTILSFCEDSKTATNEKQVLEDFLKYVAPLLEFVPSKKSTTKATVKKFAEDFGKFLINLVTIVTKKPNDPNESSSVCGVRFTLCEQALSLMDKLIPDGISCPSLGMLQFRSKLLRQCVLAKQHAIGVEHFEKLLVRFIEYHQEKHQHNNESLLPRPADDKDFSNLVLLSFIYGANCIAATPSKAQTLEHLINTTCMPWINHFGKIDPQGAANHKASLLKLLTSVQCDKPLDSNIKLLQYQVDNAQSFFANMLRMLTKLEGAGTHNNSGSIEQFYHQSFALIKSNSNLVTHYVPEFGYCVGHFGRYFSSVGKFQLSEEVFQYGIEQTRNSVIGKEGKTFIAMHLSLLLFHSAYSLLEKSLHSNFDSTSLQEACVKLSKAQAYLTSNNVFEGLTLDSSIDTKDAIPSNYIWVQRLGKCLMDIKKFYRQKLYRGTKDTSIPSLDSKLLEQIENVLVLFNSVLDTTDEWGQELKEKNPNCNIKSLAVNLACTIAENYSWAATIATERGKLKKTLKYKDMIVELMESCKEEEAREINNTSLHCIAVRFYQKEMWEESASTFLLCCEQSERWINGDSSLEEKARLSKAYHSASSCYLKLKNFQNARENAKLAIIWSPEVYTNSPTNLLDHFLRLLHADNADRHKYTSEEDMVQILKQINPPLSPSQLGRIMEDYFALMVQFARHSPQDLLGVLDQLLEVYTEREFPLRRARVLVEKSKIVRVFNPAINGPDPNTTITLLSQAIELQRKVASSQPYDQVLMRQYPPAKTLEICKDKVISLLKLKKKDYEKTKYWLKIACSVACVGSENEDGKMQNQMVDQFVETLVKMYPKDNKLKDLLDEVFCSRKSESVENDVRYLLDELAITHALLGVSSLESKEYSLKPFLTALALWNELTLQFDADGEQAKLSNAQKFHCLDDTLTLMSTLYTHKMCINLLFEEAINDLLGLLDQPILQLHLLNLIGKISSYARPNSTRATCDTVDAYSSMAQLYLDLGYNFLASQWKDKAANLLITLNSVSIPDDLALSYSARTAFEELECRYQFEIGNIQESDSQLSKMVSSLEAKASKLRQDFTELGMCKSLRSTVSLSKGNLIEAFNYAASAFNDRKSALPQFFRHYVWNTDGNEENIREKQASSLYHGKATQWRALRNLLESLEQSGRMHELMGDFQKAGYYYLKGHDIGNEIGSPRVAATFSLSLAQLHLKSNKLEESKKFLQEINNVSEEFSRHHIRSVVAKMLEGDLQYHQKNVQEAKNMYTEVEKQLKFLMDPSQLPHLETTRWSIADLPKEFRDLLGHQTNKNECVLHLDLEHPTFKIPKRKDCTQLYSLYDILKVKMARVETAMGNYTLAENLLNNVLEDQTNLLLKATALYSLGKLHLDCAGDGQLESVWRINVTEELLSKTTASKESRGRTKASHPPSTLASATKYFLEAFEIVKTLQVPSLRKDICKALALVTGRKNQQMASYYLNEGLGITAKTQTILKLREKQSSQVVPNTEQSQVDDLTEIFDSLDLDTNSSDKHASKDSVFNWEKFSPEEFRETIDQLPDTWTVCSVALSIDGTSLLITRWVPNCKETIIRIPLLKSKRPQSASASPKLEAEKNGHEEDIEQDTVSSSEDNVFVELENKLTRILSESDATSITADSPLGQEHWQTWWNTRCKLDKMMGKLLESMEDMLGCWKMVLLGPVADHVLLKDLKDRLPFISSRMQKLLPKGQEVDQVLCELCLSAVPYLNGHELEMVVAALLGRDIENLTSSQAKEVSGLVEMFKRAYEETVGTQQCRRDPVILLLDKQVQRLPWENIPSMRDHPASRMPSLEFVRYKSLQLAALLTPSGVVHDGVDPSKTWFVLNPSADLKTTQNNFESYFALLGWQGVVATEPTTEQFQNCVLSGDLFVYCGHGGGEKYLNGETIRNFKKEPGVSLLMGCSSGALHEAGEFEPAGNALNYLIAGCPAVVGNLWNVTDIDIDKFTYTALHNWVEEGKQDCLIRVIPEARKSCKLSNLIGAAVVYYGVPVYIQRTLQPTARKASRFLQDDSRAHVSRSTQDNNTKDSKKKSTKNKAPMETLPTRTTRTRSGTRK